MSLVKPLRLLLLGAPGAGKGTQTSRLLKSIPSLSSISSGDLLRLEIANKTEIGAQAANYISKGELLPDSLMVNLVYSNLLKQNWLNSQASWLLDGFPRTVNQASALDIQLKRHESDINLVVEIDVPEDVILERIENRWVVSRNALFERKRMHRTNNCIYSTSRPEGSTIYSTTLRRSQGRTT